jgi:SAM-dependent methyltransferase
VEKTMTNLNRALEEIAPHLPLSNINIIWRLLDRDGKSLLDLGCGRGQQVEFIKKRKPLFAVGVDLFKPVIQECKRKRIHDEYIIADVRFLPFRQKSFDIILCLHVIEHLSKDDGLKLIMDAERVAFKQLVIATPVGFFPTTADDNPLQVHKSGWEPYEFKKKGYKIRGQSHKLVYGKRGLAYRFSEPLKTLTFFLSYALAPIAYFIPERAAHCMICSKSLMPRTY